MNIASKFLSTSGVFERHVFQGMATSALYIRMREHDPAPADEDRQRGMLLQARSASEAEERELQERFVTENLRRIFRQIYRMVGNVHDAQDLTQEAFIKALQRHEQLKDELKAANWLSRIATNTALDFLRRHGRVAFCEMTEAPESHTETPEAAVLRSEQRDWLAAGMERLTPRERAALVLRDMDDLPAEEVAARLDCSKATVRSHIANARTKLKKFAEKRKR
ncbi:MAG: sigma-70 family RNA polymerase sigma factor [Acidobacteriota bacterium]|nr:sigma-70 family RNA polymerase sigma factor [Acidobacteriota bacterium]